MRGRRIREKAKETRAKALFAKFQMRSHENLGIMFSDFGYGFSDRITNPDEVTKKLLHSPKVTVLCGIVMNDIFQSHNSSVFLSDRVWYINFIPPINHLRHPPYVLNI